MNDSSRLQNCGLVWRGTIQANHSIKISALWQLYLHAMLPVLSPCPFYGRDSVLSPRSARPARYHTMSSAGGGYGHMFSYSSSRICWQGIRCETPKFTIQERGQACRGKSSDENHGHRGRCPRSTAAHTALPRL